jgi:hypothetical protein
LIVNPMCPLGRAWSSAVCGRRRRVRCRSSRPSGAISNENGADRDRSEQETAKRDRAIRTILRRAGERALAPADDDPGRDRRGVDVDLRTGFAAAGEGAAVRRGAEAASILTPERRSRAGRFAVAFRRGDQNPVARRRFRGRLARFDAAAVKAIPAWNLPRHLRV